MTDYSIINKRIANLVTLMEITPLEEGADGFNILLDQIAEAGRAASPKGKEKFILDLFDPDMDKPTAELIIKYFIYQTRHGKTVRDDIKNWVLNALERAIDGENFDVCFSLIDKYPKTDISRNLRIRAHFEILRLEQVLFQDAQAICAEEWGVSETTIANIHRDIKLPAASLRTLQSLKDIDFPAIFFTTK